MKLETVIIVRPFMIEDYENVVALWQDSELPYRPHGRDSRCLMFATAEGPYLPAAL